jgi:hypothetical protein
VCICYPGQANRFYPIFIKKLKEKYDVHQYYEQAIVDNCYYRVETNIELVGCFTLEEAKKIIKDGENKEILTGAFHPKRLKEFDIKYDFCFTVITEPINRFHRVYNQVKKMMIKYPSFKYPVMSKLGFGLKEVESWETWVDACLENNFYRDVVMEHMYLLPKETEDIEFVGISEKSNLTKEILSKKLTRINFDEFYFEEEQEDSSYRRKDLEKALEPEINLYNKLKDKLKPPIRYVV